MAQKAADTRNALAFGMVAPSVMCDPNHTPLARVLYAILASYARGPERIAARLVPNRHRLAAMLGTDSDGLDAALAELETAGIVTATWRSDRRGRVSVMYQLHDAALLFGGQPCHGGHQ
ncbi:hypothetical protein [Streptomyces prasinopilosus]|uniref:hypothetical protein n=1 Tax=Streptomyces prasinopilosus TaxID=67344 RepID=UPI0006EBA7C2|nr:hypothetical protein [Streptomyces prasinopilosus]